VTALEDRIFIVIPAYGNADMKRAIGLPATPPASRERGGALDAISFTLQGLRPPSGQMELA